MTETHEASVELAPQVNLEVVLTSFANDSSHPILMRKKALDLIAYFQKARLAKLREGLKDG